MKTKIYISIIALFISGQAFGQADAISKYFSHLEDDRSNTVISISGMMFSIFSKLEADDEDDQEILDAMSKLTGLKILTKDAVRDGFYDYKEAIRSLPKGEFEVLMKVREEDQDMSFLVSKENGRITELLMVSGGDDSFFLLSIVGDIDLETISKISKSMDIEGLEDLDRINDKKDKN